MTGFPEDAIREILEPSQQEVSRVVAAALATRSVKARNRVPLLLVTAVAVLIALVIVYAGGVRPFTEPLPFVAEVEAPSTVSNLGGVMLITGVEGRSLVASAGMKKRQSVEQQSSYRIMISKGTVP